MFRIHKHFMLLAASLIVASNSSVHAQTKDIVDTAVAAGNFKTLAAALQAADLVAALKSQGPFTVFAPTDEAFAALPAGTVESLLRPENKKKLAEILTFHVVPGNVKAAEVVTLSGAKTLNGQFLDIQADGNSVVVDGANVITADIACSNGVIHVIDRVILPADDDLPTTASKAGNFTTLVTAVKAAGLAEVLASQGPFTVFAPTDEAFSNLPAGTVESLLKPENKQQLVDILKYHVVAGRVYSPDALAAGKAATLQGAPVSITADGEGARVNNARLLATDIDARNGVIHVIDRVLLPSEAKQVNAAQPHQMIAKAINKGAPLYNAGHHEACAEIYRTTLESIVAQDDHGMCPATVRTINAALNQASSMTSADARAWKLRHAMDHVYANTMTINPQ